MTVGEHAVRIRRSPGPRPAEVLAADALPVSPILLQESEVYLGSEDLPKERYTSLEFHQLEIEKVWRRVWQVACREEDLRDVGDHVVYEIGDHSIVVVRSAADAVTAFHNSCLHRGTLLRAAGGKVDEFRCPFHGWSWSLDGALKRVPAAWDFPHVDRAAFRLPECKVGIWAGWVFVNLDAAAPPLDEYLEALPSHFEPNVFNQFTFDQRWKSAHVAKVVDANWKVCMEAFIETYHVSWSHPQFAFSSADQSSQYDVWSEQRHYSRMINLTGFPSPEYRGEVEPQDMVNHMLRSWYEGTDEKPPQLAEGGTARHLAAAVIRARLGERMRVDLSHVSDSELIDSIEYFVFPNFMPWAGIMLPLAYRFRPFGNDPHRSIMEVMLLSPLPDTGERPDPVPTHWLATDECFGDAPELGYLGPTLDQDVANCVRVQRGLRAAVKPGVTLGNYQEVRTRHYHQTIDEYIQA